MRIFEENVLVDTGRKLNVLCTFNLRPVSTEVFLEAATGAGFFAIFTGKHLLGSHFNKVAGLWACNFIKKDSDSCVFIWIL